MHLPKIAALIVSDTMHTYGLSFVMALMSAAPAVVMNHASPHSARPRERRGGRGRGAWLVQLEVEAHRPTTWAGVQESRPVFPWTQHSRRPGLPSPPVAFWG